MARRNQRRAVADAAEARNEWLEKYARSGLPDFGTYLPKQPASSPTAYFYRRYSRLGDALKAFLLDAAGERDPEAWSVAKEIVRTMLGELERAGSDDEAYGRTEKSLRASWMEILGRTGATRPTSNHADPQVRGLWEVIWWIYPLIFAYGDPRRFFHEVIPARESNHLFDRERLIDEWGMVDSDALGTVLATWGFGATLNTAVREAMDTADPVTLNEALAIGERRSVFKEGRPRGRKDSKPRPGRVRPKTRQRRRALAEKLAASGMQSPDGLTLLQWGDQLLGRRDGVTPAAIKKRAQRERNK